jgi:hypothetical protein
MTTDMMFAVFADFNVEKEPPELPPPPQEQPAEVSETGELDAATWTDGYLAGRQQTGAGSNQALTAKLLTSLHDLDRNAAQAVDAAALMVADLLVNTVIAVAADNWSAKLLGRVRMVADRIKPALTMAPEFLLRNDDGSERRFGDIADLSLALEDATVNEGVTIRWRRGQATISRAALLEDLREAVVPLSASQAKTPLATKQNAGQLT